MKKFLNRLFTRGQPTVMPEEKVVIVNNTRQHPIINEPFALKLSAVFRCTQILSGTIASIPLNLKRKNGDVFSVFNNKLNTLFTCSPNQHFNAFDFKKEIVIRTVNSGNAFILPVFSAGEVDELILLSKNSVTYDSDTHTYHIADSVNKIYRTATHDEIIHIKNLTLDGGYMGISTIAYASRVLGIAQSADEQSLETFEGGSMIKGMIAGGETVRGMGELQEAQLKTVADRVDAELRSGKNIIELPAGTEFKALQMTVAEAKLLEHREFSLKDICRFYGVDPERVFAGTSGNYKASESTQINFLNNTLNPILSQIECEFSRVLLYDKYRDRYKIEFDRNSLFITDLTSKANYYKTMLELGAYTVNEIRAQEGRLPVEGGNDAFISTNLQSLKNPKVNGTDKTPDKGE